MGVDVAHLVLEALGDTGDHVVDDGADCAEGGDVLAGTVVHLDRDGALAGVGEGDAQVAEILHELAARALNGDDAGLDVDLDCCAGILLVSDFALCVRIVVVYGLRIGGVCAGGIGHGYAPPSGMSSDSCE